MVCIGSGRGDSVPASPFLTFFISLGFFPFFDSRAASSNHEYTAVHHCVHVCLHYRLCDEGSGILCSRPVTCNRTAAKAGHASISISTNGDNNVSVLLI